MRHFPNKWKPPLHWLAWCAIVTGGLLCALAAIWPIDPDSEPIATAQLQRLTHAEQEEHLKQAIARQAEHPTLPPQAQAKPIQEDLIAIREDLATLQFMVALILVVLGAALASVLIAGLATLIPMRTASPKPPHSP